MIEATRWGIYVWSESAAPGIAGQKGYDTATVNLGEVADAVTFVLSCPRHLVINR